MNSPLFVTQPYLPNKARYTDYLEQIWQSNQLTNGGVLYEQLTERLKALLGVSHLLLVSNGTIALQIAYKIKKLKNKNIITTPFTFAATATALDWQEAKIVFSTVNQHSWNLCPEQVSQKILKKEIGGIVPVNLFGMPCDLDAFESIKQQHNIPIIYDSAHAMNSTYKGRSIYQYGDMHCISFHATKLFHTIEGGAITFNNKADYQQAKRLINFGQDDEGQVHQAGINGKLSEFHAAMGLCVLDDLDALINSRTLLITEYQNQLGALVQYQTADYAYTQTPIYMPIKLASEAQLQRVQQALFAKNIHARRYFCPQSLQFLPRQQMPTEQFLVLCLPLSSNYTKEDVTRVCNTIKQVL